MAQGSAGTVTTKARFSFPKNGIVKILFGLQFTGKTMRSENPSLNGKTNALPHYKDTLVAVFVPGRLIPWAKPNRFPKPNSITPPGLANVEVLNYLPEMSSSMKWVRKANYRTYLRFVPDMCKRKTIEICQRAWPKTLLRSSSRQTHQCVVCPSWLPDA